MNITHKARSLAHASTQALNGSDATTSAPFVNVAPERHSRASSVSTLVFILRICAHLPRAAACILVRQA